MFGKKSLSLLAVIVFYLQFSASANDYIQIRFSTDADVPTVTVVNDSLVTVAFDDGALTTIFSNYTIIACVQSFPSVLSISHPLSAALNRVYDFTLASGGSSLMSQLGSYTGSAIVNKYVLYPAEPLLLPDDYNSELHQCGASGIALRQLNLIKAPDAWDITTGSSNIKIAVIDNGYLKTHEDLSAKIQNPNTSTPVASHGTGVAGTVAADTDNGLGIAAIGFDCQLLLYPMFNFGYYYFPEAILEGAKIINCSWYSSCFPNQNHQDIITLAHDQGVVVVAAAGNSTCGSASAYNYPAAYDHVISVTGVGHYFPRGTPTTTCNGRENYEDVHLYRQNSSSSYITLQHNDKVDLAAPGYDVTTLNATSFLYWTTGGSSLAAPFVSGAAGLILSLNDKFTPDEVEGILKCSASDLDNITENASYVGLLGAGRLDAEAALIKAQSMITNKPTDITWYYYNSLSQRIDFEPEDLSLHINSISNNTIYTEASSRISNIDFDWEFIKGGCRVQKSGNPVSFNLSTECSPTWCNLVAHVKNQLSVCDPDASTFYREVAYIDPNSMCTEPYKPKKATITPELETAVKLYPNPATSVVIIELPSIDKPMNASLRSTTGTLLRKLYLKNKRNSIDISGLPSGIYFISIELKDRILTQKLIIGKRN